MTLLLSVPCPSQKAGKAGKAGGSRRRKQGELDELDELEEDVSAGGSIRLEKQPKFVTGAMREYQVKCRRGGGRHEAGIDRRLP